MIMIFQDVTHCSLVLPLLDLRIAQFLTFKYLPPYPFLNLVMLGLIILILLGVLTTQRLVFLHLVFLSSGRSFFLAKCERHIRVLQILIYIPKKKRQKKMFNGNIQFLGNVQPFKKKFKRYIFSLFGENYHESVFRLQDLEYMLS